MLNVTLACTGLKKKPPYHVPVEFLDKFSMNDRVKIIHSYVDDTRSKPLIWSSRIINETLNKVKNRDRNRMPNEYYKMLKNKGLRTMLNAMTPTERKQEMNKRKEWMTKMGYIDQLNP